MMKKAFVSTALIGSLMLSPLTGCESLPGNDEQQGTAIGGLSGAAAGALIGGDDNRLLGALIGGALGAGGGYLIGANKDKITGKDDNDKREAREEAIKASERAERDPAKAEDVDRARSADLNDDGFVTLDEVVAMRQANLSDREMLDRLERTDQVFELTDYQEDYLRTRGVSDSVIREMRNMNQDFARTASDDGRTISDDRDSIDRERYDLNRDRGGVDRDRF